MGNVVYFNAGGYGLYLTVSEESDMVRKYVEVSGRSEEFKNMDERDIMYSILGGKGLTDEYNMRAIIPIVKKPSQEVLDAMEKEKPDGAVFSARNRVLYFQILERRILLKRRWLTSSGENTETIYRRTSITSDGSCGLMLQRFKY